MRIQYSKQAVKFLKTQGVTVQARIQTAILKLPLGDVVKLKGQSNKYRLRVGDYRVIFTPTGEILYIEKIDNRGQAYKK